MAKRKNPWQPILDKIPAPLRNRYYITLLLFFGWLIFFDKHDFFTQWELQQSLENLQFDKVYYQEQIGEVKEKKQDLELNQEKYAREKYYMRKKNEDVFVIEKEEN
ncbi:MAG: septum formation initiator family protein [Saprospiraceae bacterium]